LRDTFQTHREERMAKDDELHLNDPAHTASSEAHTSRERREAADEPLESESKPTRAATGAVSGLGGAAAGGGTGMIVGGPIGAAVGAIAGALGGWWVGHARAAADHWSDDDDAYFRQHYETLGAPADRTYDSSRPAYQLGHLASRNPDYADRKFDEIETDLRHGWTDEVRGKHGTWDSVRERVRAGYERPRESSNQSVSSRTNIRAGDQKSGSEGLGAAGITNY
jgi:hypothetical protein